MKKILLAVVFLMFSKFVLAGKNCERNFEIEYDNLLQNIEKSKSVLDFVSENYYLKAKSYIDNVYDKRSKCELVDTLNSFLDYENKGHIIKNNVEKSNFI